MILNWITDFLFPPFCISCKKQGEWWCEECRSSTQKIQAEICPKCLSLIPPRSPFTKGGSFDHTCGSLPFTAVRALGYYHDPKLRPVITGLKFYGTTAALRDLECFISSQMNDDLQSLIASGVLIPMPLHNERLRERGFNQAELIASIFSKAICTDLLVRSENREAQSSLAHDLEARSRNIKNCFKCLRTPPENIILVDDVITTGSTAAEAARALISSGTKNVSVLTLAIGA